jgi:2-isopropylmalate synthase
MSPEPPVTGRTARPERVEIFDTTLRDGSQREGVSLTVDDKLRIAEQLDHLGLHYIEGGWPGANPKDEEFFRRAPEELHLGHATLVAFGSTRRAGIGPEDDDVLRNLVKAGVSTVCIVGKAWDYHVVEALRTTLDEAVAMVSDSVEFLRQHGLRVFFDAEHFFDGYLRNPEFSLRVVKAAEAAGAEVLVLCDTNGGTLPHDAERVVAEVVAATSATIGVHFHDDGGCAVANALGAVRRGATQVQGCMNGLGERTGNANLTTIIPNLTLKMGVETIPMERLERLTAVSHHIAELVNIAPDPQAPYVGASAFAHKAGLHVSAIARRPDAYEHVDPEAVGNGTRFVVSELAGRSTLVMKMRELGLDPDGRVVTEVLDRLKHLEHEGFHFEVADGSLELLIRRAAGLVVEPFTLERYRVIVDDSASEATVKVHVGPDRVVTTGEGNGPVNALDDALRKALRASHPGVDRLHLTDYKVRVLDSASGTGAVTRVLIDTTDGERSWTTIGVGENVIDASWQALADSLVYGLALPADSPA